MPEENSQYPDVNLHILDKLTKDQREKLLLRTEDDLSDVMEKVKPIIEAVRNEGDMALARYAREFDGAPISASQIVATEQDFNDAFATLDPEMIKTLEYSADNIRRYHERQKPEESWTMEVRPGVHVGERFSAIESAALYSPRGKGSFPSVTLMTCIPATVAGVKTPYVLTPPGADGKVDAATLVAAKISGVDRVYKAGGALAVAAAAFGTETIPKARKLEGPGSPWFVAAKRLLSEKIASRLPAGPSESIVLADESANPDIAALDTIIESEHGSDSSVFLVTWSREIAEHALKKIPEYWKDLSHERATYSSDVLSGQQGGVILARDAQDAYDFINAYAPEHCQVISKDPDQHLPHILTASEIMLGEYAAGSIANYMMGPNCVLPTSGAAHVHSPLGVMDFMRSCSVGRMNRIGFNEMAPHTKRFATYEGFDAHANAVSEQRLKALGNH